VAYTSEIEKLEKRWAENPKGRNFAPLADAYRKAGELDRALELCKSGLDLHPDYVSAHIVYARCLIDQKNDAGASDVFRKVLSLDPENVLALKILADIAERGGRYDEAVEWLSRLLNADPMNGDAAEALGRAKGRAAQAAGPEPVVRLVPSPPRPPPPPQPDFVVEHVSEAPAPPVLEPSAAPSDIETFDGTLDFNALAHDAARADGLEVQEEVELKPQDLTVEGLARSQYESGQFAMPPEAVEADGGGATVDLPLIMPDDLGPPFAPPPTAPPEPPASSAPVTERAPAVSGARGFGGAPRTPPASPTPPPPPAAVALSDDDGAADTAALSQAEPVLTETMAELYLRQGHEDDALRVYQALLAQRPGDARLRARVTALTGGGTGESVQTFLRRILAGRPGRPGPGSREAEPPSSGSPLDGAFAAAAAASVEAEPGIDAPGEATRPAGDNISLDQVFGDEGARTSLPAGEAPAEPAPHPAPAPAAPSATGGFSFDQFFSAGPESGASGGSGAAPKAPGRTSGSKTRPPAEDEGDLDQFQAWLKGLKS
jgi:tetratricopeptide (TPR) repeat protein